jgi:hypothetical protein
MITTDPGQRPAYITGLRDLAGFLTQHPEIPVPEYGTEILLHAAATDDGGCTQVDTFARQTGGLLDDDLIGSGHYAATASFGPVGYRLVAISHAAIARHHASHSYYGSVTPEPDPITQPAPACYQASPPDTWT